MAARILIADDNPAVRTALRQLLDGPGRELFEAGDGVEAVAKALEHRPDVAVLDLVMPTMDGLTAAREISKQFPQTALLMCTMHSSPQLLIEAQKHGIRKVISKAQGGEVVTIVQELLDAQAAEAPIPALVLPPDTLHPPPVIAETAIVAEAEAASPAVDVPLDVPPVKES